MDFFPKLFLAKKNRPAAAARKAMTVTVAGLCGLSLLSELKAAPPQRAEDRPPQRSSPEADAKSAKQHCDQLFADRALDPIRAKVRIGGSSSDLDPASRNSKPSASDKATLSIWGAKRLDCDREFVASMQMHPQAVPPQAILLREAAATQLQLLLSDLVGEGLAYGEFEAQRQKLTAEARRLNAEVKRLMSERSPTSFDRATAVVEAYAKQVSEEAVKRGLPTVDAQWAVDMAPYPMEEISKEQWQTLYDRVNSRFRKTIQEHTGYQLVVFSDPARSMSYAFTLPGHPAHPAYRARKTLLERGIPRYEYKGYYAGSAEFYRGLVQRMDSTDQYARFIALQRSGDPKFRPQINVKKLADHFYAVTLEAEGISDPFVGQQIILPTAQATCGDRAPKYKYYRFNGKDFAPGATAEEVVERTGAGANPTPQSLSFYQEVQCVEN